MFVPAYRDVADVMPLEMQPAGAISVTVGMALTMKAGALAIATGGTKPEYIAMVNKTIETSGELIPVSRVDGHTVFESELSAANTSIAIGNKYTIDTTGTKVTATTTDGVAEVVSYEGTAVGAKVRVRFA